MYSLQVSCNQNIDCDDGDSCTEDICESGKCQNPISMSNCCGNGMCEVNEDGCDDCGPFTLIASDCLVDCHTPHGIMFDLSSSNDITLHGLRFKVYASESDVYSDVTVYTAPGSYADHYNNPSSWTQVHQELISTECEFAKDENPFRSALRLTELT